VNPKGDTLSIHQVDGQDIAIGASVTVRGGTVTLDEHNSLVFAAAAGFSGPVIFDYTVADSDGLTTTGTVTSSAYLASLVPQIETALAAHGLPHGTNIQELLSIASVVAPGAFGAIGTDEGPGYHAAPGHDLNIDQTSPDTQMLLDYLVSIVGAQTSDVGHPLLAAGADGTWISAIDQGLVFQAVLAGDSDIALGLGGSDAGFSSTGSAAHAWSRMFAQLALDPDMSADQVTQADGHAQGHSVQSTVQGGDQLSIHIDGSDAGTPQAALSNLFGFVDFVSADGSNALEVARTVMVAQTAGGADDQHASVSMRQNGVNAVEAQFYRVDDYAGTIGGLKPGDAGYDAASDGRAYHTTTGTTWIAGAGYGQYSQAELVGVNSGDLIVMRLSDGTHDYYAFAQANETVDGQSVNHAWNYGMNTWGWEDLYGGGDHDFNDLVVRLDFVHQQGDAVF
jgi:hypothetical protein